MKFLMVSKSGEGAGILKQIQDEGNDCEIYIKEERDRSVHDGILTKAKKIDPDEDTIIIFDMSGMGNIADNLIKEGYKVFGASGWADQLETDRQFGLDTMRACGIKLPETEEFTDFEEAADYLGKNEGKKFVFKPSGKMPCKLTYCSEDNEDLLSYMKFVEEQFGNKIDSFVLQEFVEGSVVSSEIFFNGSKVVGLPNHTVETKKAMNDDLGPSTGCTGNLVWLAEDSEIVRNGVAKIEKILQQEGYVGQIDLNAVVNEKGIFGLEWTPRFGFDATPVYLKMIGIEYGKFFSDIVNKTTKGWPHKLTELMGVRFSIPPFPAEPDEGKEAEVQKILSTKGTPIRHWQTHAANIYFYEVMMNKEEQLVHSDGLGVIGIVFHESPRRIYDILDKIKIPDMQYRTDLPKVLSKMKKDAEKWE